MDTTNDATNDRPFRLVRGRFEEWQDAEYDREHSEPGWAFDQYWQLLRDYRAGIVTDHEATRRVQQLGVEVSVHFFLLGVESAKADGGQPTPPAA